MCIFFSLSPIFLNVCTPIKHDLSPFLSSLPSFSSYSAQVINHATELSRQGRPNIGGLLIWQRGAISICVKIPQNRTKANEGNAKKCPFQALWRSSARKGLNGFALNGQKEHARVRFSLSSRLCVLRRLASTMTRQKPNYNPYCMPVPFLCICAFLLWGLLWKSRLRFRPAHSTHVRNVSHLSSCCSDAPSP